MNLEDCLHALKNADDSDVSVR